MANNITNTGFIYGLHAGDYEIRYVGLTIWLPKQRFAVHRKNVRRGAQSPVYGWMRKYGFKVQVQELAHVSFDILDQEEMRWIAILDTYRPENPRGLNLTRGGYGLLGYSHSDETRANMKTIQAEIAHKKSATMKIVMRELYDSPRGVEVKQKLSLAGIKRFSDPEERTRLSEKTKGIPKSDETRAKMRVASVIRANTPEAKARTSAINRKRFEDPAARAAIGESNTRRAEKWREEGSTEHSENISKGVLKARAERLARDPETEARKMSTASSKGGHTANHINKNVYNPGCAYCKKESKEWQNAAIPHNQRKPSQKQTASGKKAMHVRWHEKRGIFNEKCNYCTQSQVEV